MTAPHNGSGQNASPGLSPAPTAMASEFSPSSSYGPSSHSPSDSSGGYSSSPADRSDLTAVLGPTNTGKTHLAIDRMLGRESGMIGLPLRLLAREVYDKVVRIKGEAAAALITGEEKIAPKTARYFICTVEAMPVGRKTAFLAIDEVQLAADHERGHVFTQRLLHARGTQETMLLGSATMRPAIRTLVPDFAHEQRERLSQLSHTGPQKLAKLPRRSAIVAFSSEAVYSIAELLKRQRGGAAVVMGALSPRTRNAQVELYQSGEVDFLVATDAIGMGLNMDIDHVAFAALHKFDGARRRVLRPDEIAQIAGRAGRHTSDGTFGVTGDCRPLPDDVVQRVVDHEFQPVNTLMWRNHSLDFSSIEALTDALKRPSPDSALRRAQEAADEIALTTLARDEDIAPALTDTDAVRRLWSACQIPDFRKSTIDHHVRLIGQFARHLLSDRGRIPQSWAGAEIDKLDKTNGEVDALAARLAHIRTWTYAANRAEWFDDPAHWRGVTREVEDRLSDALHERLTQRFVDRRTSALVRGLNADGELDAHVNAAGEVVVEGHHVGRLDGLTFHPDNRSGALEGRALRNAALKALRPEIHNRLTAIADAPDPAITLHDDLRIWWGGAAIAKLIAGPTPLSPAVWLLGAEDAPAPARDKAKERLTAWAGQHIKEQIAPLKGLSDAVEDGSLVGLARGVAFRLVEGLGSVDRRDIASDIRALSQEERRALRDRGVRFGEFALFMPDLVRPKPARLCALLLAAGPTTADPEPDMPILLPPAGRTSMPSQPRYTAQDYAAAGYHLCGSQAVRFDILERLAQLIRQARAAQHAAKTKPEPAQDEAASAVKTAPITAPGSDSESDSDPAQTGPVRSDVAAHDVADGDALSAEVQTQTEPENLAKMSTEAQTHVAVPSLAPEQAPSARDVSDPTDSGPDASSPTDSGPNDSDPTDSDPNASGPDASNAAPPQPIAAEPVAKAKRKPALPDPGPNAPFSLTPDMMNLLGCSEGVLEDVLKSLGFRCVRKAVAATGSPGSADENTPDHETPSGGDDAEPALRDPAQPVAGLPALWQAPRHARHYASKQSGHHSGRRSGPASGSASGAAFGAVTDGDDRGPRQDRRGKGRRDQGRDARSGPSGQRPGHHSHRGGAGQPARRDGQDRHGDGKSQRRNRRKDDQRPRGPRTFSSGKATSSPADSPFAALADMFPSPAPSGGSKPKAKAKANKRKSKDKRNPGPSPADGTTAASQPANAPDAAATHSEPAPTDATPPDQATSE